MSCELEAKGMGTGARRPFASAQQACVPHVCGTCTVCSVTWAVLCPCLLCVDRMSISSPGYVVSPNVWPPPPPAQQHPDFRKLGQGSGHQAGGLVFLLPPLVRVDLMQPRACRRLA